jgi:acetyltransferase
MLREDEALRLVAHFSVEVLPSALATTADEAVDAATRLGYPVVLKVDSDVVLHKSDSGGVHLDLRRAQEVHEAFEAILSRQAGGARGVRITPYRGGGVEVLVGARRDAELGPLLLVGAGGVLAEAMGAVAIRLIPCSETELRSMLDEAGVSRLLLRPRAGPPLDPSSIVGALRALARLLTEVPAVEEVEVNPLRCAREGNVALDARVILSA